MSDYYSCMTQNGYLEDLHRRTDLIESLIRHHQATLDAKASVDSSRDATARVAAQLSESGFGCHKIAQALDVTLGVSKGLIARGRDLIESDMQDAYEREGDPHAFHANIGGEPGDCPCDECVVERGDDAEQEAQHAENHDDAVQTWMERIGGRA